MAIARHAVVDASGKVVNVTMVDPQATTWTAPAGQTLVDSPLCANANPGDTWTGSAFTPGPAPAPDPLAPDMQRLFDYMPISGSVTALAVSAYIQDVTKPTEIRATMAALRSLLRVLRGLS